MFHKTLQILAVLVCFAGVVHAQVRLERKYEPGQTYSTEVTSRIDQSLQIAGMDTKTAVDSRFTTKSTVGERDAQGGVRVEETIESMQITLSAQGAEYSFDSANPDTKGTSPLEFLRDIHKAMLKRASTVVIDKDNKILRLETDQTLLASLPVEVQAIVKSQLDPEYLKKVAIQEANKLPSEPVEPGDTWLRTENVDFGAGQLMTFQTEYTYQGTVEKNNQTLDQITQKVLSLDFSIQNSPLPLTLKSSDLKATEVKGDILFDRKKGQVVESHTEMRIVGDLAFTVNDMDLPAKLDLKMKTTAKVR